MIQAPIKNLPASVRQRLLNLADKRREPFQRVLVQYGLERLLYRISRSVHRDRFEFEGAILASAIRNTFDRRKTALPSTAPVAIPDKFSADSGKQRQWASFLAKSDLEAPPLPEVVQQIEAFLSPPGLAAAQRQSFHARWVPPGPWQKE